ncbi:Gfo/Idh/MocA family oxidoreductase [Actinoallomurus spadix]|uniref:Gfo/Idh/MocA family oxidoreductase n=1 Tax=Actinoallomurus spadix TaxID=79912 RepID=A0ABN0XTE7_9ACTN|nr:Gfo/Idh/MocA family oxidoreductase [Actinoallomurus spadix]MCO5991146.1 Gfo/Idh/MocA family oxidoreductase [Actinoallomurus spadix]
MDNLRVALIGYGTGGAVFHAPLISAAPGLDLAAVVTRDPARRAAVRDRYPGTALLDAPGDVWSGGYDLVVVTTPNRTHAPLARAALDAGLPVVVDKPVAVTAAEARSLAGGPLVVPFHNRRWDGDFRTAARLIGEGTLGRVLRFESRFTRWRPQIKPGWKETADPAAAGGVLYDLGAHLIDQAITLFGPPVAVHAELDVRRPGAEAVDDAFAALTHANGVRSHLWMSAISADLGPRFRVLGDRAAYVTYGLDGQEDELRAGRTPQDTGFGVTPPEAYGGVGTPGDTRPEPTDQGRYQDFYPAVAAAVRGEGPPPVTLEDAIAGLEVIETATRSSR